ncbi:polysaccharide biosynthesis/export family protein [Novosphingobium piscinae]|uniref:Polysaccharide export protein n=1 Tax=Novosphingobium piscinae TaxID=1507448 RepID=A0A7X1FZ83_9SPHN|nr:polysaccharide biosynthesis/export family protein [Novosphingobium piscinae]MBC2669077.1 polysaccharide export protein [Novosphingobium piscinae]
MAIDTTFRCPVARRQQGLRRLLAQFAPLALLMGLAACSSLGASGPSGSELRRGQSASVTADIRVIDLTDKLARRMIDAGHSQTFAAALGEVAPAGTRIGRGDVLDVAIWESPPAALFGTLGGDVGLSKGPSLAPKATSLLEQMVGEDGKINIPFVGSLVVAGRTPQQVARDVEARLAGKAHEPQVIVRVTQPVTSLVTVVGDVSTSTRIPLTAKGERLLDALAGAGGVKQPIGKVTVRITRGTQVVAQPLEQVLLDPRQNITLQAGDVITALYQPYSFTALGAVRNSAEVPFEGTGLSLAQGLGRIGGLDDNRANVRGVFVFRLEDPAILGPDLVSGARLTPDGRVPVIYRLNMSDPGSFFVAQGFALRDKDVVYVSNAPLIDIQKFIGIVSQTAFSIIGIANQVR